MINAFMNNQISWLHPSQYNCPALQAFLETACEGRPDQLRSPRQVKDVAVLVDDRRDPTGWLDVKDVFRAARDWDGYNQYPP